MIVLNHTVVGSHGLFGSQGTVVGISGSSIEVLIDESYIGGCNLGGRVGEFKGVILEFGDIFNISR